jgi:hypothetical protein
MKINEGLTIDDLYKIIRDYFNINEMDQLNSDASMCFIVIILIHKKFYDSKITHKGIAEKLDITRSAVGMTFKKYKENPKKIEYYLKELMINIYFKN